MDDTVTLTRQEYEDLVDARDHAIALAQVASGAMPTIPDGEMDAYLEAQTPLMFWRQRSGITQTALAAEVGISQPYLAQLESGVRKSADVTILAKMAKRLGVRIEDLLEEE